MGDGRSDGIAPVMTTPYLPCQSNHHDRITPKEGQKNFVLNVQCCTPSAGVECALMCCKLLTGLKVLESNVNFYFKLKNLFFMPKYLSQKLFFFIT